MDYKVKVRPNSRKEEVFNMLKLNPNSTTKELSALMPHIKIDDISHAVSSMADKSIVFVTGKKSEVGPSGRVCTHRAYSVKYEKAAKAPPQNAPATPQPNLFAELINTLEAEVTALELWKEAALLRYPDLDVNPLLLEARALLAAEAVEEGSEIQADGILKGNRDHSFSVRALVKILGSRK
jgi:hypothetical protein